MTTIKLRRDTAANWTTANPVLEEGEVGIELDTRKQKIGDGVTAWNSLAYDYGSTALQSITSSDVTSALGYTPVNKAGDTMTGNLTVPQLIAGNGQSINIGQDNRVNLIMSNVSKGTTPSTQQYQGIQINDGDSTHSTWQAKRLSGIEASVTDTGESKITITTYKNEANSTTRA